eukprot:Platyproteum_vivax@DN5278_c0_g1_i2.p1
MEEKNARQKGFKLGDDLKEEIFQSMFCKDRQVLKIDVDGSPLQIKVCKRISMQDGGDASEVSNIVDFEAPCFVCIRTNACHNDAAWLLITYLPKNLGIAKVRERNIDMLPIQRALVAMLRRPSSWVKDLPDKVTEIGPGIRGYFSSDPRRIIEGFCASEIEFKNLLQMHFTKLKYSPSTPVTTASTPYGSPTRSIPEDELPQRKNVVVEQKNCAAAGLILIGPQPFIPDENGNLQSLDECLALEEDLKERCLTTRVRLIPQVTIRATNQFNARLQNFASGIESCIEIAIVSGDEDLELSAWSSACSTPAQLVATADGREVKYYLMKHREHVVLILVLSEQFVPARRVLYATTELALCNYIYSAGIKLWKTVELKSLQDLTEQTFIMTATQPPPQIASRGQSTIPSLCGPGMLCHSAATIPSHPATNYAVRNSTSIHSMQGQIALGPKKPLPPTAAYKVKAALSHSLLHNWLSTKSQPPAAPPRKQLQRIKTLKHYEF